MASYIGNKPVAGEFKRLDSIAGQFNGVLTSFTLNFNSVSVSAGDASQLIVSLDGVVQEPLGAYTLGVGGSTIVFGTAPVAGSTCHIVQLGGVGGTITGTLTDNIVTTAKIGAGAVTSDRITIDGDISFPTNDKLIFSNSLKVFHDGSDGFVTNDTGQLILRVASVESALVAVPNGAVTLYHDNQPKIATTTSGINVTGTVAAHNLSINGGGVTIATSGTNTLTSNGTLRFDIDHDNDATDNRYHFTKNAGAGTVLEAREDGDVKFYNAAGTDVKLFWDASAESLSIGVTGSSTDRRFQISSTGPQTATTQYGIVANPTMSNDVTGSIYNIYSQANVASGATLTNLYSVYVGAAGLNSSTVDNVYGIYQAGTSDKNYFAGKIGIGGTNAISTNPQWDLVVGSNNSVGTNGQIFVDATVNGTGDGITIDGDGRNTGDGSLFLIIDKDNTVAVDVGTDGITNIKQIKQVDLTPINTSNSDTAVDIFVYDTRKDSDGGAWRKRTQNTSWYNEALNTSKRGARKEFPSVAVIVAEVNQVTIYDGDDPDMPMWMVFNGTSAYGSYLGRTSGANVTSVHMLNGNLCVGRGNTGYGEALLRANFISEHSVNYAVEGWRLKQPIAGRDLDATSNVEFDYAGINAIINIAIHDVSMTVLPNAPIDPATELPVPTIAVATETGLSVIKDSGIVVDITIGSGGYNIIKTVDITPDGYIAWRHNDTRSAKSAPIPDQDKSYGFWTYGQDANNDAYNFYESHAYASNLGNIPALVSVGGGLKDHIVGKVVSGSDGLTMIGLQKNEPADVYNTASLPLTAYITNNYNTGWMMSGITLATLSSTDNVMEAVGTELVTNGTFDSNVTGWTAGAGSTLTHQSGQAKSVAGATNILMTQQLSGLVVGQQYVFTATITPFIGASGAYWGLHLATNYSNPIKTFSAADQTPTNVSATFTATATNNYISIGGSSGAISTGEYLLVDNVSVRLAEEDRSWHENGLQVFGALDRDPVATGAELQGYSGFTSSNYLQQPYNSDLDFGTGSFSIAVWLKPVASTSVQLVLHRRKLDGTGTPIEFGINSDETPYLYTGGGTTPLTGKPIPVDHWAHVVAVRKGTFYGIYVNGKLFNSNTGQNVDNIVNADAHTLIGGYITNGSRTYGWQGSMALLRVSSTAPSTEQIEKMYNDEKHLFATNAKATIYGSSTNPSAIAYDDDTESLHVGTSAGRSVFQGLNRVDNTTDAVGVAISASNGLVAEE